MEKVLDEMKISKKDKGQFIFRKDEKCNKIVIPLEGNLIYVSIYHLYLLISFIAIDWRGLCFKRYGVWREIYASGLSRWGVRNEYSGPILIIWNIISISDDVVMGESGIITEIEAMDFIKVIGGPLPIILKKNEHSHEVIQKQY